MSPYESPHEKFTLDYKGRTWTGWYTILHEKGGIETLTVSSGNGSVAMAFSRRSSVEWHARQLLKRLIDEGKG